jgi:hypothetical protein
MGKSGSDNTGDTIESFVIVLAYDGVYRSWLCLTVKSN